MLELLSSPEAWVSLLVLSVSLFVQMLNIRMDRRRHQQLEAQGAA